MKSEKVPAVLSRMKKNDRRGGPVSKMVMAALVLASTAGFVSGLSRNVFNDDGGLPGWVYVRELFSGSLPGQLIAGVTAANHPAPPRNVTRSASVVSYLSPSIWLERYGSRPVIEPREIAAEPAENTVGVNANGTATFDPSLFNIASTTTVPSVSKSSTTTLAAVAVDLYWDGNGATAGTGGTGLWTTANHWRTGSDAGALVTWTDGNNAHFLGSGAGVVTITGGTTVTPVTSFFELTGYTLSSTSATTATLGGNIVLSAGVNLTLNDASVTTDRSLAIGPVTGGAGSSLTISGAQTATGSNSRVFLSQANASIDVPVTISGTGTTFAGFVATATGTGVTGTITNNSSSTTLLGATAGNDLTLSSTSVISGSAGLLIGVTNSGVNVGTVTLNAANTYLGNTTLNGGTLVLGNDSALSSGTLTLSSSSTSVLQASSARALANNIVWGGNGTISGGNAFTFNGSFTSSGAAGRTMTVSNTGGLTIGGNVFLAPDNSAAGGLTINGTSAVKINGVIANNSGLNTNAKNLTYSGSNTLTLTNANTYTGTTTVSGGTLLANNTTGSATGSGPVTVTNSGSVLGGTGIINSGANPVTINANAAILGGNGTTGTTLTVAGNLTLNSGSIIELALGPSLTHSTLARTGGTWTFDPAQMFTFINLGATTGTYDNIITGLASDPGTEGSWTITNSGFTGTFTFDGANIDLNLTAVPEPSTWAGGALALIAVAYTQRRRFSKSGRKAG